MVSVYSLLDGIGGKLLKFKSMYLHAAVCVVELLFRVRIFRMAVKTMNGSQIAVEYLLGDSLFFYMGNITKPPSGLFKK